LTAIGRIRLRDLDKGTGFTLGPRLVVTANHVARDGDETTLSFAVEERRIAVERVERDEVLDVAVLHLAEDAPATLEVGRAEAEASWRVEAQPRDNDPMLSGSITATRWRIANDAGHDVVAMQLKVDQAVGWHAGYSGGPVTSPPGSRAAVGVLVEQVLLRVPQMGGQQPQASNVLYAIPIEDVLERFGLGELVQRSTAATGNAAQAPPAEVTQRVSGLRISPAVEHWRDRDELRAELRILLLSREHRVISVVGRRGIGKSALVAKVLAEFEDGGVKREPLDDLRPLVYLSSRRSGDLTLAGVYQAVAAVWEDDEGERLAHHWQSGGVAALPDLWQKMGQLQLRPVLVLDNLDDLQDPHTHRLQDEELIDLLDSACRTPFWPTIVTTSQRPLEIEELGACTRVIEIPAGLTGDDAVAVIRDGAPSGGGAGLAELSDAQLAELATRVDGRPRGLQKLGFLVDGKPRLLRRLLESESAPDEIVDELVSTTYAEMTPEPRAVMQLLALNRGPLPEDAVPGLLAGLLDPDDALDAIDYLVDAGEVKAESDVLELHPLDADHVRDELMEHEPARQVELDERLAAWWAGRRKPFDEWRTLDDATASKREYRHLWRAGRRAEALAVMAAAANFLARTGEGPLVMAAVRAAERDLAPDDVVGRFHARRCEAMVEFFAGSLDASLAALQAAHDLGVGVGLPWELADVDVTLGTALRHKGDTAGAIEKLSVIADTADVPRDQRQFALFDMGLAMLYRRDVAAASATAARLAELTEPGDPSYVRAQGADLRALAAIVTGDFAAAEPAAAEGIELYRQSPYLTNVGYLMNVRAVALLGADRVPEAIAQLEEGLAMAAEYRDDRLEGFCATNLAWAMLVTGDRDGALLSAERGADRLASNAVTIAASPRALADAIRSRAARPVLAHASELAEGNPDIHLPSAAFLDAAAAVVGR
jgi:tetratricopeptide (TPR) repeat protein